MPLLKVLKGFDLKTIEEKISWRITKNIDDHN